MEENIDLKFKVFLFKAYSNYYGLKSKLIKNETIYCKDIILNTLNLDYKIYSIYGVIDSNKFFSFKGNWTYLLNDLREELNKIKESYVVVKALKKCKR